MTPVKFCGLTRPGDYRTAVALGAAFCGFIFHKPSPRYVDPGRVSLMLRGQGLSATPPLPGPVPGGAANSAPHARVGVFVDASREEIRRVVEVARLDLVQLHGNETPEFARSLGIPWWKAVRLRQPDDLLAFERYPTDTFLIDAWHPDKPGGSGLSIDLDLVGLALERARELDKRVIVAGGLHAGNLAPILALDPWAVDINSGVEAAPGAKDAEAMGKVMALARGR